MPLHVSHKNVVIALEVLHKAVPTIPAYSHESPVTFLCDKVQQECWLNKCASRSDGRGFQRRYTLGEDDNKPVTWYVWKQTESKQLTKVVEDGTTADLLEHVKILLAQFLEHCFVKRAQSEQYQIERNPIAKPLNKVEALIQVDFSENYTCMFQDEVKSMHWSRKEVSILTAAFWFPAKIHSTVLVSDNLDHSKETIIPYIDKYLRCCLIRFKRFLSGAMALHHSLKIDLWWQLFHCWKENSRNV